MPNCNATTGEGIDVYTFTRGCCVKTVGPGVSRQIQSERKNRNDAAAKLTVGNWVLFAVVNDEEDDQVWLGRVMSNPAGGGQGVCQNTTRGIHFYSNKAVVIGQNEVALNSMW